MDRNLTASGARWAIATPHTAATEAGAAAFDAGGNAADAALAAAVTLAVVYPHMCGVGGDLFALVAAPDGSVTAINASGAAPAAIDAAELRARSALMPQTGPASITVPGAVSGWAAIAEHGLLPLASAFDRSLAHARDGVQVAPSLADTLQRKAEQLAADPGMRGVFFEGARVLREGERLVQPGLAATLERLRDDGPGSLYGGEVGARYAEGLRAAGSPIGVEDLARHRADATEPLRSSFHDLDLLVAPPNSQGFVLLEILAAVRMSGSDPDPLGPDVGLLAEIFRLTSADRDRYNADPRRAWVPVEELSSDAHLRHLIEEARAHGADTLVGERRSNADGDTIALVAADAEGNAVSLIQSLYSGLGSGILEPSTGIVAQNRGACFSLDPASPNALEGGKRPAHTLMPVLAFRGGGLAAVAGTMGGGAQPQINAQNLLRSFSLGLEPGEAIAAPRWAVGGDEPDASFRFVEAESAVREETCLALEAAGFTVHRLAGADDGIGHAHLIRVADDGRLDVASDPRADGSAAAS